MPVRHIVDRSLDTLSALGVVNDGQGLDYFIPAASQVKLSDFGIKAPYILFGIGGAHQGDPRSSGAPEDQHPLCRDRREIRCMAPSPGRGTLEGDHRGRKRSRTLESWQCADQLGPHPWASPRGLSRDRLQLGGDIVECPLLRIEPIGTRTRCLHRSRGKGTHWT